MAERYYGVTNQARLECPGRDSGMIVSISKVRGRVFYAGCSEWIAGPSYADKAAQQMTEDVLNRFLSR